MYAYSILGVYSGSIPLSGPHIALLLGPFIFLNSPISRSDFLIKILQTRKHTFDFLRLTYFI